MVVAADGSATVEGLETYRGWEAADASSFRTSSHTERPGDPR